MSLALWPSSLFVKVMGRGVVGSNQAPHSSPRFFIRNTNIRKSNTIGHKFTFDELGPGSRGAASMSHGVVCLGHWVVGHGVIDCCLAPLGHEKTDKSRSPCPFIVDTDARRNVLGARVQPLEQPQSLATTTPGARAAKRDGGMYRLPQCPHRRDDWYGQGSPYDDTKQRDAYHACLLFRWYKKRPAGLATSGPAWA